MSTIPTGTKFRGVKNSVDTENKGSSLVNSLRDAYTIEDLAEAINTIIEDDQIIRLVPHFQTGTPGGSDTYTEDNNIVDFDWVGGNGVYEYILPSAAAIPYRKIRFVNNGTISNANRIRITAPGAETIDGDAFYEIRRAYNGCAVWSDGVEWVVIQAKG